eukprot:4838106-Prorocentrum_lima.AAC.1
MSKCRITTYRDSLKYLNFGMGQPDTRQALERPQVEHTRKPIWIFLNLQEAIEIGTAPPS